MDDEPAPDPLSQGLIRQLAALCGGRRFRGGEQRLARQLADALSEHGLSEGGDERAGYQGRLAAALWTPALWVEMVLTDEDAFREELARASAAWPNDVVVRCLRQAEPSLCAQCGQPLTQGQCSGGHRVEWFELTRLVPGATARVSYSALKEVVQFNSVVNCGALARYTLLDEHSLDTGGSN